MLSFITKLLINGLALIITAMIVPGFVIDGPKTAFIAAIILGLANSLIKPVIRFLTLPLRILTLGLFTVVINTLILAFVSQIVAGFSIEGWVSAVIGTLVLSVISSFLSLLFN